MNWVMKGKIKISNMENDHCGEGRGGRHTIYHGTILVDRDQLESPRRTLGTETCARVMMTSIESKGEWTLFWDFEGTVNYY